jgi:hypothetical protein
MKEMSDMSDLRDLSDMNDLKDLSDLRDLKDLKDLRDLKRMRDAYSFVPLAEGGRRGVCPERSRRAVSGWECDESFY